MLSERGVQGGIMNRVAGALVFAVAAFALCSTTARASSMDTFVVTANYDASAGVSGLSNPSDTITLTFSVPNTVNGGLQDLNVPITIGFDSSTYHVSGGIITFFSGGMGGLFNVDLNFGGNAYEWQLLGPQSYDSSNNVLLGSFAIVPTFGPLDSQLVVDGNFVGLVDSGTVMVSPTPAATPEPSSLLLLGTGLLALGILTRRQFAHA
jgi:hypothetical protein